MDQFKKAGWNWTLWTYKEKNPHSDWSLYISNLPNEPHIETDSYETLATKWGEWDTEISFQANKPLHRILREALRG